MDFRFASILLLLSFAPVVGQTAESGPPVTLYGLVLPTWTAATGAVDSFGQPNLSAYTAAGDPTLQGHPTAARATFQVAQSRVGLLARPSPIVDGRLELDFIDFTKASPTTAAQPRLRRAVVEYRPSEGIVVAFGQDWDLISPLGPHGYNLVGHYFQSGDIGFMRLQAQLRVRSGGHEHAVALGFPAANNGAADGPMELGGIPTVALRESWDWGEGGTVGLSALAGGPRTGSRRLFAGALTVFAERKGAAWELRGEAYVARNANHLGLLGIASGGAADTREVGAYLTARHDLGVSWGTFAGAGGAWRLDDGAMGMERNGTLRLGLDVAPAAALRLFAEAAALFTRRRGTTDADREALVTQLGMLLTF